MSTRKITVHRLERHIQPVEVEIDADLPDEEAARQARQMVADGEGEEVGTLEYHSTDPEPSNWSIYSPGGRQIG